MGLGVENQERTRQEREREVEERRSKVRVAWREVEVSMELIEREKGRRSWRERESGRYFGYGSLPQICTANFRRWAVAVATPSHLERIS